MSTEYTVAKNMCESIELFLLEHSGRFDVSVTIKDAGTLDIVGGLTVERMAEVGIKFLEAALYNCGDVEVFRKWLHKRIDEVDSGGRTALSEVTIDPSDCPSETEIHICPVMYEKSGQKKVCQCDCRACKRAWFAVGQPVVRNGEYVFHK